jgi:hypothetical protein
MIEAGDHSEAPVPTSDLLDALRAIPPYHVPALLATNINSEQLAGDRPAQAYIDQTLRSSSAVVDPSERSFHIRPLPLSSLGCTVYAPASFELRGDQRHRYFFPLGWPTEPPEYLRPEDVVPSGQYYPALPSAALEELHDRGLSDTTIRDYVRAGNPEVTDALEFVELPFTKPFQRVSPELGSPVQHYDYRTHTWEDGDLTYAPPVFGRVGRRRGRPPTT